MKNRTFFWVFKNDEIFIRCLVTIKQESKEQEQQAPADNHTPTNMALSHTMEFLPMPYGTDKPHGDHEESNGFYHDPMWEKCLWRDFIKSLHIKIKFIY